MPENKKLYRRNQEQKHEAMMAIWVGRDTTTGQHITLTEEFGKLQTKTILTLPRAQTDRDLLLKVTSLTGEYDNSRKKTDKDTSTIPPHMYELRSPAMPAMKQKTGITQQESHYKPPDQPSLEQTQRVPKFPTIPKRTATTVQPPPGLLQPEPITAPPAKTTPSNNDLLATIDTGVLHLSTSEDAGEKKLSTDNMILQDWYDDDNEDYDAYDLKTAIKEKHDALQKTQVFTR
eukprot:2569986-Amphidinium_carterae.1